MKKAFDLSGNDVVMDIYEDDSYSDTKFYLKDEIDALEELKKDPAKKFAADIAAIQAAKAKGKNISLKCANTKTLLDPNQIILVNLTYYICPICISLGNATITKWEK
jgi:hypothetical protein